MLKDKSTAGFKEWKPKQYINLARKNPVKYLCNDSNEFFYMEDDKVCLNKELEKFINNKEFLKNVKDAIEFRTK